MNVRGIPNAIRMADRYLSRQQSTARQSTLASARMVHTFVNDNIAPVDRGLMVNSSYTASTHVSSDSVGARIVYPQPYAKWVELNPQEYAHGSRYNEKHAADIQSGKDHARKDTERDHFLSTSVLVKKNEVYQLIARMAKNVSVR